MQTIQASRLAHPIVRDFDGASLRTQAGKMIKLDVLRTPPSANDSGFTACTLADAGVNMEDALWWTRLPNDAARLKASMTARGFAIISKVFCYLEARARGLPYQRAA